MKMWVTWLVLLGCMAWRFPAGGAATDSLDGPYNSRPTVYQDGQTNGGWAAWVEAKLVGSPMRRALTFEHKLYVRGPSTNAQRLLYTMVSTSGIDYRLGPDGLLVFAPNQGRPQLVFPGREPFFLPAPQPTKTNFNYRAPHWGADKYWFTGGALIYESYNGYAGADYLLGYFLLDTTNKTVIGRGICVELKRPERAGEKNPDHPGDSSPMVCRDQIAFVGTHILWMNVGWPHGVSSKIPPSHWRTSQLRAFDLESKRFMSGAEIPAALLAKHKEVVERISRKLY